MIGVKFNRAMRPYGAGDTALLPEAVGERLIGEGSAERYEFPSDPHASGAIVDPSARVEQAAKKPPQTYKTKGAR